MSALGELIRFQRLPAGARALAEARTLSKIVRYRRLPTPVRPLAEAVDSALAEANSALRTLLAVEGFDAAMRFGDFGDAVSLLMDAGDRLDDLAGELRETQVPA